MNTFHISPSDPLASQVAEEIRGYSPETLVAVRGQEFYGEETVYTVSPCPDQQNPERYLWAYVRVGEWLDEFYTNQGR